MNSNVRIDLTIQNLFKGQILSFPKNDLDLYCIYTNNVAHRNEKKTRFVYGQSMQL